MKFCGDDRIARLSRTKMNVCIVACVKETCSVVSEGTNKLMYVTTPHPPVCETVRHNSTWPCPSHLSQPQSRTCHRRSRYPLYVTHLSQDSMLLSLLLYLLLRISVDLLIDLDLDFLALRLLVDNRRGILKIL